MDCIYALKLEKYTGNQGITPQTNTDCSYSSKSDIFYLCTTGVHEQLTGIFYRFFGHEIQNTHK